MKVEKLEKRKKELGEMEIQVVALQCQRTGCAGRWVMAEAQMAKGRTNNI